MFESSPIVLLIPAYKPSAALIEVIRTVRTLDATGTIGAVVVVDDGSGPEYKAVFSAVQDVDGALVIRHAVNLGKGAALKTGFNFTLVNMTTATGVVTADADGQHSPSDIIAVAEALRSSPDRMVLGCRQFDGDVPMRSRFGNTFTRYVFTAFTGMNVADTQTGLRGWPRLSCAQALRVPLNGYDFELECLVSGGRNVRQVPIETIYIDQNRSSHFNPLRDSMRIYFTFVRYCGSSMFAALVDSAVFYTVYASSGSVGWGQFFGRCSAVAIAFFITRTLVFQSNVRVVVALSKYLTLVAVMGFVSYSLLQMLHSRLGVPIFLSKMLAEGLLFLGNFAIQREFIFVRR